MSRPSPHALRAACIPRSLLCGALLALMPGILPDSALAQTASSSVTMHGRTVSIGGGGSQSIGPGRARGSIEVVSDGESVTIGERSLTVQGETHEISPGTAIAVIRTATGLTITEGDRTVATVVIDGADRSSPESSIEALRARAEAGDAGAWNNLAWRYEFGDGVDADPGRAVEYYRRAAELGLAAAQTNLAHMYFNGSGTERDYAVARDWALRAAEQGEARAEWLLGRIHEGGLGVARDLAEAVEWYTRAAEGGNDGARTSLGVLYSYGRGVAQDQARALDLYRQAAEGGYATAQLNIFLLFHADGFDGLEAGEALRWLEAAAAQDLSSAWHELGLLHLEGDLVAQDREAAQDLFVRAAGRGNSLSMFSLAMMLSEAPDESRESERIMELLHDAAERGHRAAQNALGHRYFNGLDTGQDDAEALFWFRRSADGEYPIGLRNLGMMHEFGHALDAPDLDEAARLYVAAQAAGHRSIDADMERVAQKIAERPAPDPEYWYGRDGQRHGPVPGETMRRMIADGEIGPQALIWRRGLADWLPLEQYDGLR